MNIRQLTADEVSLCVQGGQEFFAEGKMPGGFVPEEFVKIWQRLIGSKTGTIIGAFTEDEEIVGAIAAVLGPSLFSAKPMATEAFWFVREQYRKGRAGIQLLMAFEEWGKLRGAKLLAMIHLHALQPERLSQLYTNMGYTAVETNYVREIN